MVEIESHNFTQDGNNPPFSSLRKASDPDSLDNAQSGDSYVFNFTETGDMQLNTVEDLFFSVEEIIVEANNISHETAGNNDVESLFFSVDEILASEETPNNEVEQLFGMTVEEIVTTDVPVNTVQIKQQDRIYCNSSSTQSQSSTIRTEAKPTAQSVTPKSDISQAYAVFQKYSSQLQQATAMMADHRLWCTGADGHTYNSKPVSPTHIQAAQEQAFINIMNTGIGKKLEKGENLTDEEKMALIDITAATNDRMLGTKTREIVQQLNEESDFSWNDPQVGQRFLMIAQQQHIHGANCDHGGGVVSGGGVTIGGSISFGTSLSSILGKSHEHHEKSFYCQRCKKTSKIHVHGKGDMVCPGCKSRNLREIKKQHSH